MRIAITGGTGFVGRRLSRRLLELGNEVVVLTRQSPDPAPAENGRLRYCSADIRNFESLRCSRREVAPVDIVYHLAADLDYFGHPGKLHATNVLGTQHVIRWAHEIGARKFVYTSSIEAIGPIRLKDVPADGTCRCHPVSSYGVSKLRAERVVAELADTLDLDTAILRLGCVYGPGSYAFIPQILLAILNRQTIYRCLAEIQERFIQLLYIDDAVAGLIRAEALMTIGRPLVFAHERYITVGELFAMIARLIGRSIEPRTPTLANRLRLTARTRIQELMGKADLLSYLMAGGWERAHRAYAIDEAIPQAGIEMKTGLEKGIQETLMWFQTLGDKEHGCEGFACQSAHR